MNEQTKITAMQELIEHLDRDVELKLSDKKTVERVKWYIETYFLEIEKNNIVDAHTAGNRLEVYDGTETAGEQYYNQTFKPIN